MRKGHCIHTWTTEHVATGYYECNQCGAVIYPTTPYIRRVFAYGTQLDVFREHSIKCSDTAQ